MTKDLLRNRLNAKEKQAEQSVVVKLSGLMLWNRTSSDVQCNSDFIFINAACIRIYYFVYCFLSISSYYCKENTE